MWQGFDMYGLIWTARQYVDIRYPGTEWTYATVGTVCATALLGGLVDLDVLDDQVAGVETLGIGVGLGVLEETEKELGRLDGPPGAGDTPGLAYCLKDQLAFNLRAMHPIPSAVLDIRDVLAVGSVLIRHLSMLAASKALSHPLSTRKLTVSYLERCGRWNRRTGAWGRPPCAPGRSRGT